MHTSPGAQTALKLRLQGQRAHLQQLLRCLLTHIALQHGNNADQLPHLYTRYDPVMPAPGSSQPIAGSQTVQESR